jgi:hypothetical protein
MKPLHVFTIMAGCVPVGLQMLESYFKYHSEKIHVYVFSSDTYMLSGFIAWNMSVHVLPDSLRDSFLRGHEGTAKVWARVMKSNINSYLIQVDSDIIFKKESLSLIERAGYPDIYGSRRCYKNNPGKAPVQEGLEDAISTYFIGFNHGPIIHNLGVDQISDDNLERMIQGVYNPHGFPVLDFFDPVFFHARKHGASVYYEEPDLIGGQDVMGSKVNSYASNLHLDMGSHLAHFGGVGSGYVNDQLLHVYNTKPLAEESYVGWSMERWELFQDLFIAKHPLPALSAKLDESGRWIGGPYNKEIYDQVKADLNS